MVSFPTALDTFTEPPSPATTPLDDATYNHTTHHTNLGDAIEALEAKVGVNNSAVTTSLDYKVEFLSKAVNSNRQTASYTLVLADAGKVVEQNVASSNNLTVPPNSSVAFIVGTVIEVFQYGAGQTTIVAGAGVTLRAPGGKLKLTSQYSSATLRKIGTDEWAVAGDLST